MIQICSVGELAKTDQRGLQFELHACFLCMFLLSVEMEVQGG